MKQEIKIRKGFIQIPLLIGIIVSIIAASGIGYGTVEYNKTSKTIREAEQLTKEEKYDEAIAKLVPAQNQLFGKMIFKQKISTELDTNKKLLEDRSEYAQGLYEFNKGNWEQAKTLLSKVSETFPHYQDAKSKIEEAQKKQITEATNKAAEEAKKAAEEEAKRVAAETQLKLEQQIAAEAEKKQAIGAMLSPGNLLSSYYDNIRKQSGLNNIIAILIGLEDWGEVDFAADLAKHSLGENIWPQYESRYYSQSTQGGGNGSYSYSDAKKILDNMVFLPYTAGVSYTDSDSEKIKKILDFVDPYVYYQQGFNDVFRAPAETLGLKSGDCKSYSILVSAALADAGINSAVMFVNNIKGGDGHAMVLVQSNEDLPLSESYSDLTQYGLTSGRWWVIEPQYPFEGQQQHPEWFAKWKIEVAALVPAIK